MAGPTGSALFVSPQRHGGHGLAYTTKERSEFPSSQCWRMAGYDTLFSPSPRISYQRIPPMQIEIFTKHILSPLAEISSRNVVGFLSTVGSSYGNELMVIGRATNGWRSKINTRLLQHEEQRTAFAHKVYRSVASTTGQCPMSWVTDCWGADQGYNAKRSAFWRVIRRVVGELGVADIACSNTTWPSHLGWSNLYKIAPQRGNPNRALIAAQQKGCIRLLHWEVERYRPRRLLFLTGLDWAEPFLARISENRRVESRVNLVQANGRIRFGTHSAAYVVARHPQGKNETEWVQQAVTAFQEHRQPMI
jgi:hypothetical protein